MRPIVNVARLGNDLWIAEALVADPDNDCLRRVAVVRNSTKAELKVRLHALGVHGVQLRLTSKMPEEFIRVGAEAQSTVMWRDASGEAPWRPWQA